MGLREDITAALKEAMKAGDKKKLGTVRLMQAAIKDKDIAGRTDGHTHRDTDGHHNRYATWFNDGNTDRNANRHANDNGHAALFSGEQALPPLHSAGQSSDSASCDDYRYRDRR